MKIFNIVLHIVLLALVVYLLFTNPWSLVPLAAFFYIWDNITDSFKKMDKRRKEKEEN